MYCGSRNFKTSAAVEWTYETFNQLNQDDILAKFEKLRSKFDPIKHAYQVSFLWNYPASKFYTKKGDISSRTMDLSNIEKGLIDLIFLSKYFDKPNPQGCQNLNIDDRYINRLVSEKRASEDGSQFVDVEIKIVDL